MNEMTLVVVDYGVEPQEVAETATCCTTGPQPNR